MCGSAMFATEVSSTSMNVASVTMKAMTQGLWRGATRYGRLLSLARCHICLVVIAEH